MASLPIMLTLPLPATVPARTIRTDSPTSASLDIPPTTFSLTSHLRSERMSRRLAVARTRLGPTALIAYPSSFGLCIAAEHILQQSRAGGCGAEAPSNRQQLAISGWGYSATAGGPTGTSEVIGLALPSVTAITATYSIRAQHHTARALLAHLGGRRAESTGTPSLNLFLLDLPTCISGAQLHLDVLEHGRRSVIVPTFNQRAACIFGDGYAFRGPLSFGSLPTS
jgi:hypothetical protein